jgi:hypothetical protein
MQTSKELLENIISDLQENPTRAEIIRARHYLQTVLDKMQKEEILFIESERIEA